MRTLILLAVVTLAGCALALLGGCAALQANIQRSQFAAHCYAERDYPDLLTADGCTERDVFNGQEAAARQAALNAKLSCEVYAASQDSPGSQGAAAMGRAMEACNGGPVAPSGATPPGGMQYFLSRDLGVHGVFHLCEYSDDKIYSFNATDLCPMQVTGNAIPEGSTGFKVGEYLDGVTRVCVYNVLGTNEAVRIDAAQVCPVSYNF